tara:strand:+ start:500 stop:985 length:486 start_codon:yes stop_codon:yes gene_type:complete
MKSRNNPTSQPSNLHQTFYIKLRFAYQGWVVPGCAAGVEAILLDEPELISTLPKDVKADQYSEQLKSMFGRELVRANFYLSCGALNQAQAEIALENFRHHYHHFKHGLPTATIGEQPKQNEIILNLTKAVKNAVLEPNNQQALTSASGYDYDKILANHQHC